MGRLLVSCTAGETYESYKNRHLPTLPASSTVLLKGTVSRDWEWVRLVPVEKQRMLVLPVHIFDSFRCLFSWFNSKKRMCFAVSHLKFTLWMMSDSRRLSPVITALLPIDQATRRYCSDRREFEIIVEVWLQLTSRSSWSSKVWQTVPIEDSFLCIKRIEKINLRLSLIIRTVTVKWETAKTCFFWKYYMIRMLKRVKNFAPATRNS